MSFIAKKQIRASVAKKIQKISVRIHELEYIRKINASTTNNCIISISKRRRRAIQGLSIPDSSIKEKLEFISLASNIDHLLNDISMIKDSKQESPIKQISSLQAEIFEILETEDNEVVLYESEVRDILYGLGSTNTYFFTSGREVNVDLCESHIHIMFADIGLNIAYCNKSQAFIVNIDSRGGSAYSAVINSIISSDVNFKKSAGMNNHYRHFDKQQLLEFLEMISDEQR